MKIRIFKVLDRGVYLINCQTEDWSQDDIERMLKFGEPQINVGGTFTILPETSIVPSTTVYCKVIVVDEDQTELEVNRKIRKAGTTVTGTITQYDTVTREVTVEFNDVGGELAVGDTYELESAIGSDNYSITGTIDTVSFTDMTIPVTGSLTVDSLKYRVLEDANATIVRNTVNTVTVTPTKCYDWESGTTYTVESEKFTEPDEYVLCKTDSPITAGYDVRDYPIRDDLIVNAKSMANQFATDIITRITTAVTELRAAVDDFTKEEVTEL